MNDKKDLNDRLLAECTKDSFDLCEIERLLAMGADPNYVIDEWYSLYDTIIDDYTGYGDDNKPADALVPLTKLFISYGLTAVTKAESFASPYAERCVFLRPYAVGLELFLTLMQIDGYKKSDFSTMTWTFVTDILLEDLSKEEQLQYLKCYYWAVAYSEKYFPGSFLEEHAGWELMDKTKYNIECVSQDGFRIYITEISTGEKALVGSCGVRY